MLSHPTYPRFATQFVFGELRRQDNVKEQDLKHRRSLMTWGQYMLGIDGGRKILDQIQKEEDELSEHREKAKILETGLTNRRDIPESRWPKYIYKIGQSVGWAPISWASRVLAKESVTIRDFAWYDGRLSQSAKFAKRTCFPCSRKHPWNRLFQRPRLEDLMKRAMWLQHMHPVKLEQSYAKCRVLVEWTRITQNQRTLRCDYPIAFARGRRIKKSALEEEKTWRPTFAYQSLRTLSTAPINTGRSQPNYLDWNNKTQQTLRKHCKISGKMWGLAESRGKIGGLGIRNRYPRSDLTMNPHRHPAAGLGSVLVLKWTCSCPSCWLRNIQCPGVPLCFQPHPKQWPWRTTLSVYHALMIHMWQRRKLAIFMKMWCSKDNTCDFISAPMVKISVGI